MSVIISVVAAILFVPVLIFCIGAVIDAWENRQ